MNAIQTRPLQQTLLTFGGISTAALILSIPFSTSIAIIITGILLAIWLLSAQFLTLPALLKNNPIAVCAMLLLALFFIGISYSSATVNEALSICSKYRELFLLIVLLPFLSIQRHREWAFTAFITGAIATLCVSYAMWFDLIPRPLYAATLKGIITHSIMVSFFAFFSANKIIQAKKKSMKIVWAFILLLTLHNLFFVAMGRTGQFIGLSLAILFCFQHLNKKQTLIILVVFTLFLVYFIKYSSVAFRVTEGIANVMHYNPNKPETESSMGRRLTFWKNTVRLIEEKPWLGHGTGSFKAEYQRIAPSREIMTVNPHNAFLYITAQLGIPGFLAFIGFLGSLYECLNKLPSEDKMLAQGLLVSFIITCLFNTPILDHTEGHWYISLIALLYAPLTPNLPNHQC